MKQRVSAYRRIVGVAQAGLVAIVVLLLALLHVKSVEIATPIAIVSGIGLAVIVITQLLVGRLGSVYKTDFGRLKDDPAAFKVGLERLGDIPLKSLGLTFLLDIAYIVTLLLLGDSIGVPAGERVPQLLFFISLGMLDSSFIFVLADSLGTKFLLDQGIPHYPNDLRVNRQQRKNFIIPTFMTLMTCTFTFSLTYIGFGRIKSAETGGGLASLLALATAYFVVVCLLVNRWTATTAMIYRSVLDQMDALSSAEKDLSRRITITSVDELGSIAGMVNGFCASLAESMDGLKAAQDKLSGVGEELDAQATETAGSSAQIAASADRVRARARAQSESVAESSSAVEQIAKNIESLETLISEQAASVTEASASIEEMVGNIGSVTSSIEKMAEQFSGLLEAAAEGKTTQAVARERISQIADRSQALLEANKVISTIASQTNLLAMNAAIEAAHAGDAGRGFSVVADEIRRLAETSAGQSKTIRVELAQVQQVMQDVVSSSRDSEAAFGRVAERIGETDAIVQEVHQAMAEQQEGSTQILEALKSMNDVTAQVRTGSHEMSAGNRTVLEEIGRLREAASDIQVSVDEVAAGAQGITEGSRKVLELATGTLDIIRAMDKAVGCFKTRP